MEANQATPDDELRRRLLDSSFAKTELEHYAARIIIDREKSIWNANEKVESLNQGSKITLVVCQEVKTHATDLKGRSNKGEEWETGFIEGLIHVRDYLIPLVYPITRMVPHKQESEEQ